MLYSNKNDKEIWRKGEIKQDMTRRL